MRRFAAIGGMRRDIPGGGMSSQSYGSVLGANMVAQWHHLAGIALASGDTQSWTDQVGGVTETAPAAGQRPTYAADGANFRGLPVVQSFLTGAKFLENQTTIPATLIPSGSRPWFLMVGRARDVGTSGNIIDASDAGAGAQDVYFSNLATQRLFWAASGVIVNIARDTNVHLTEWGADGVNATIAVDGVDTNVASANAMSATITKLAFGGDARSLAGNESNHSFAMVIICRSKPSASERAAVLALARAEWGF